MSHNYDNWERLVAAVLKRELLLKLFHADSRSPSDLSEASALSSFSSFNDISFSHSIPYIYEALDVPHEVLDENPTNGGLVFISDHRPIVRLNDLLGASSVEILGKGTFTSVRAYKLDHETTIVVKRLMEMVNVSEKDFKKHMRMIGDVKHRSVAKLKGYYYSEDEMLILCDYCDGGSVSSILHGKPIRNRAVVSWDVRLTIAIGAARGISHIHTQNGGKMVHGNIKASNIFLDSHCYGLVSDLGIASMARTTFPKSSRCYAPEVKGTQDVSQASDVFSFGVLLLELLTRKSSDLFLSCEDVDLVKFVENVSPNERSSKVFDEDLLSDPRIWKLLDEIERMLEVAISCVAESPMERPKMLAVVKMMEDIVIMSMLNHDPVKSENIVNTRYQVSLGTKGDIQVFLVDGNLTFDVKGLLRDSIEFLGNGTFGTSFKATLKNGNIVFMKTLPDVDITKEEFQQHIEATGRIGHINVVELNSYCYSSDLKLLLYHYYCQGSLSARLHGSRDSGKRPLEWRERLKIAVDAARGIAYIHRKNGQKLVHGNIRASNILLNNQLYAIVSDVGLGKLVNPTTSFVSKSAGYCAPEVTDNWKVSQASDVYSFGVVLLELLTRQPSLVTNKGEVMSLATRTKDVLRENWASEVFDVELLTGTYDEYEMEGMMHIAMSCVDSDLERRPEMDNVVWRLEAIAGL